MKIPSYLGLARASLLITPFVSVVPFGHADERSYQLEEVMVTAQKREESLQDTPVAVSAFGSEALQERRIFTVADLSTQVPALQVQPFAIDRSTTPITIRGIGNVDAQQPTKDGAVGVYIDGVYMGRAQGNNLELLDLERVEVLRGPQGTLYGRNTIGGAISMISAKPDEDFGVKAVVGVGNDDYQKLRATIDTGSWNGLAAKISLLQSEHGEWVDNNAGDGFGDDDAWGARVAVSWDANDKLRFDYAYDYSDLDYTSLYYQSRATNPDRLNSVSHSTPPFAGQTSNIETDGHALTASYVLSDSLEIKAITSARSLESIANADLSAGLGIPDGYQGSQTNIDQDQLSLELQLLGESDSGKYSYVAGLYYFEEDGTEHYIARPTLSASGLTDTRTTDFENTSTAVFGLVTRHFDDWDLSIGGRYTDDERSADRTSVPSPLEIQGVSPFAPVPPPGSGDLSYGHFDPSASVTYRWTDSVSSYLKVETGYRSGGLNVRTTDFDVTFDEEELLAYELGLKSEFWDNRARVNVAIYHSTYDDIQLDFTPDPNNISAPATVNAAEATVQGLELDASILFFTGLRLDLDYAYTDAEFDDDSVVDPFNGVNISDDIEFPNAPKHAYNASLRYELEPMNFGTLSFGSQYSWTDEYHQATQYMAREDVGLLSADITLADIRLSDSASLNIRLWGQNLQDEEYVTHLVDVSAALGTVADAYGQPRTYGVDFELRL